MDNNYFKYLVASTEDINWGLYLTVAGYAGIAPGELYPPPVHPSGYFFSWENGRVLHEYQVNYITDGSGILETNSRSYKVTPGTLFLLYPGMWHRYKPSPKTGWKEHYIGFTGEIANTIFRTKVVKSHSPVLNIGFQEKIFTTYQKIIDEVKLEKSCFHQVCSGLVIHLLGNMVSVIKNKDFEGKEIEKKIHHARLLLSENLSEEVHIEAIADQLQMSYSYFRKLFKKYTGISPAQYNLTLRIQKARDLLLSTDMSVKQVAFELGFPSIYYFTRIFKQKTGVTPSEIRKK